MKIDKQIAAVAEMNLRALECISHFLYADARAIRQEALRELAKSCDISDEEAMLALLTAYCGLDPYENPNDRVLQRAYLSLALKRESCEVYRNDPYYKHIRFPQAKMGKWEFKTLRYEPCELFIRDDLLCMDDGREIPQLGYFTEPFEYPAVLENSREWMTITPNEINTMRQPLKRMYGRVLVLGLGLGYFAYMLSEKPDVERITIVERDSDVIALFRKHILPQFPAHGKITIVCGDAFDITARLPAKDYDTVFVDLWHDVSDGVGMYLRMKRLEKRFVGIRFEYWIERSILAWLRGMAVMEWEREEDDLLMPLLRMHDGWQRLDDTLLRSIAHEIPLEIAPE